MDKEEARRRMLDKISESGLNSSDATRLGFRPLPVAPPEIAIKGAGFIIPYYTVPGKQNGFYRYRYVEPILFGGKTIRYSQPAGKSPEAYFTPLFPWSDYLKVNTGEQRVLFITEGENKANCAGKIGLPVIGLGGVWNFRSSKQALITSLKEITWENASVYIVYDSDAITNYQVVAAENALAKELLDLGAFIYVIRLPQLVENKKTGLDDFLVEKGTEEFNTIALATEPWTASKQLHELNEEVVFVHDPGAILEVATGQRMAPSVFTASVYANRILEEVTILKDGKEKVTKKSAATEWIKWPGRAEVKRTTYMPGASRIMESGEFNCWNGWGCEPVKGDVKLWKQLLDEFFLGAEKEDRIWFEQWLAYPLQFPGTKLFSASVVHSLAQGTGKTLVAYTMKQIYGRNFSEVDEAQLLGNFNAWAENKQFVMGDEIAGGDKRAFADRLKAIVTRDTLRINAKYVPEYDVPDCINYYFTSNHPDSFYFEDNDRRFFVHEVHCDPLALDFAARYDKWYSSPEGAGALFYYFLHLNLNGFNPKAPARQTAAKRRMTAIGRSDVAEWVEQLKSNPESILKTGNVPIKSQFMTTGELYAIYDPEKRSRVSGPGLSRALKSGGFHQVNAGEPVRTESDGTVRLWAIQGDRAAALKMRNKDIALIRDADRRTFAALAKKKY